MFGKDHKKITVVTLVSVFILLLYHTYMGMMTRTDILEATSMVAGVKLIIDVFALLFTIFAANKYSSFLFKNYIVWIIWLFILFFFAGMGGVGVSNYFQAIFPFCMYILFFQIFKNGQQYLKLCTYGFILLFLFSVGINIFYLNTFVGITIGEDTFVSDLMFWTLTLLPFVFLVKTRWLQITLFVVAILLTIITAKRSITITLILVLLIYVYMMTRGSNTKFRNIFLLSVFGICLYTIISSRMGGSFENLIERFSATKSDQGSGRIYFYQETINAIDKFDLISLLMGQGYASIHQIGHTNVHNDFLQMLYEYGIIGVCFYLTVFIHVIRECIYLYKIKSFYFMGFFVTTMNLLVQGLIDNIFIYSTFFPFLCAYWGMAEGSTINSEDNDIQLQYYE